MNYLIIAILFIAQNYWSLPVADRPQTVVEVYRVEVPDLTLSQENYIKIFFHIKPGYHIQANEVNDDDMIASSLKITSTSSDVIIGKPVFPAHMEFELKNSEEGLWVFSGILEVWVPFAYTRKEVDQEVICIGDFYYQACDSKSCLFPQNIQFEVRVAGTVGYVSKM